jgi:hypothetical protein
MIGATGPKVSCATSSASTRTRSEDRRRDQRTVALAAVQEQRARRHRSLDPIDDPRRGRLVDHRSHVGALVEWVPYAQGPRARRDPLRELVHRPARSAGRLEGAFRKRIIAVDAIAARAPSDDRRALRILGIGQITEVVLPKAADERAEVGVFEDVGVGVLRVQ